MSPFVRHFIADTLEGGAASVGDIEVEIRAWAGCSSGGWHRVASVECPREVGGKFDLPSSPGLSASLEGHSRTACDLDTHRTWRCRITIVQPFVSVLNQQHPSAKREVHSEATLTAAACRALSAGRRGL